MMTIRFFSTAFVCSLLASEAHAYRSSKDFEKAARECKDLMIKAGTLPKEITPSRPFSKPSFLAWAFSRLVEGQIVSISFLVNHGRIKKWELIGPQGLFESGRNFNEELIEYVRSQNLPKPQKDILILAIQLRADVFSRHEKGIFKKSGKLEPASKLSEPVKSAPRVEPSPSSRPALPPTLLAPEMSGGARRKVDRSIPDREKEEFDTQKEFEELMGRLMVATSQMLVHQMRVPISESDFTEMGFVKSKIIRPRKSLLDPCPFPSDIAWLSYLEERVHESLRISGDLKIKLREMLEQARAKLTTDSQSSPEEPQDPRH